VAMPTGLVTQLSHIELEDGDAGGLQWGQTRLTQAGGEGRPGGGLRQMVTLPLGAVKTMGPRRLRPWRRPQLLLGPLPPGYRVRW
jgi:hypothetical protein